MLYVAYGSNIPTKQILSRCPSAVFYGKGFIKDYELKFNFHADIEPCIGEKVPCVVWDIDNVDFQMLDYYEGYPRYYGRHYVFVELENGEMEKAIVYEMNIERKVLTSPSKDYVDCIRSGYKEFNLDEWHLDKAIDEIGIDNRTEEKYYRYVVDTKED